MKADRFKLIEAEFTRARRLDAAARKRHLDDLAASDPETHREVVALLNDHDADQSFLASPALGRSFDLERADGRPAIPERIGSFRIERILGAGGMGVVYLARQDTPPRPVALKLIRHGAASPGLVRRFEREAEVLARLTHPGIARVYESGLAETETGRVPFLAMEFVEGRTITEYCRRTRLDREGRLELVIQLCEAVQHAHQQGVVHRDLKPANVLVTDDGSAIRVRLLDFGVARITDADVQAGTMQTGTGQLLGTLEYMSPEQASGDATRVDTRSDIYSIGVLLFELLTGETPHAIGGLPLVDALTRIRREPPRTLSSLDRSLRGELTTIVRKTLDTAPQHRYESAAELAKDLRRFLDDEPIMAHPPSAVYQFRKFAQRNRLLVGAAAVAGVSVLAAAIVSIAFGMSALEAERSEAEQKDLADRRFRDVRAMAETLLFDLDSQLVGVAGTLPARRTLVETGLPYLDRLALEAAGDPELMRTIAAGYVKLGDVQGDPQRPNLGDFDGALACYGKAIDILLTLPDEQDTELITVALGRRGDTLRRLNRPDDASGAYRKSISIAESALESSPDNVDLLRNASMMHDRLAETIGEQGRIDEAREHVEASAAHMARALVLRPDDSRLVRDVAVLHFKRGMQLLVGDPCAALEQYEDFVAMITPLSQADPTNAVYRRDLAIGAQRMGNALERLGRPGEAIEAYRRELSIVESRVAADPENQKARGELGAPCCKIGELYLAAGDVEEARRWFDRYLDVMEACAESMPESATVRRDHAVACYKMAEYHIAVAERVADDPAASGAQIEEAAHWLRRCRERFATMRDAGLLAHGDAGIFEMLDKEIAGLLPGAAP